MVKQLLLFQTPVQYEYCFVFSPEDRIKSMVTSLKGLLNHRVKISKKDLNSIAHISLLKFRYRHKIDERIIRLMNSMDSSKKNVILSLDGVDSFRHGNVSKSLYLKIKDYSAVKETYYTLLKIFGFKYRDILPHVTLARSIQLNDFNIISEHLDEYDYKGEFTSELIVLRKTINGDYSNRYTRIY